MYAQWRKNRYLEKRTNRYGLLSMKTIRQHFEENLTEEELEKALANTPSDKLNETRGTEARALLGAFVWDETHEGHHYWDAIYQRLYYQKK
jgi:hypothetical protein